MRTLDEIQTAFDIFKNNQQLSQKQKNDLFVRLMDELEKDHHTLIINPTDEELSMPAVKLYRTISYARKLWFLFLIDTCNLKHVSCYKLFVV